ncbi:hypothetical protein ACVWZK_003315 [Bradyrhizobium sp. GM0.4]
MANAASSTVTAFRWLMGPGHFTAGAEIRNPSMLPGFRFLFAAILLSASILVFGLGAAALLRASHEQYVSNPSWRNGPQEQVFAQAPEPAQPVLAVLRAEPEAATDPTPSLRDQVPTIALPMSEPEQVVALTTETDGQPQVVAPPADVPAEPAQCEDQGRDDDGRRGAGLKQHAYSGRRQRIHRRGQARFDRSREQTNTCRPQRSLGFVQVRHGEREVRRIERPGDHGLGGSAGEGQGRL